MYEMTRFLVFLNYFTVSNGSYNYVLMYIYTSIILLNQIVSIVFFMN